MFYPQYKIGIVCFLATSVIMASDSKAVYTYIFSIITMFQELNICQRITTREEDPNFLPLLALASLPAPLLEYNVGKAFTCHTERKKTKRAETEIDELK